MSTECWLKWYGSSKLQMPVWIRVMHLNYNQIKMDWIVDFLEERKTAGTKVIVASPVHSIHWIAQ